MQLTNAIATLSALDRCRSVTAMVPSRFVAMRKEHLAAFHARSLHAPVLERIHAAVYLVVRTACASRAVGAVNVPMGIPARVVKHHHQVRTESITCTKKTDKVAPSALATGMLTTLCSFDLVRDVLE